jgi:cob(I)alamin adenosyltransferase
MQSDEEKGYIVVFTGEGKGKTTAALGMALRAIGHDLKVSMLQFIKGSMHYGELTAVKKLAPDLEITPLGHGFVNVNPEKPDPKDVETARKAWEVCKEKILSDRYAMVILDEINDAIAYGLLPVEEVVDVLTKRPERLTVVLTGRGIHPSILAMADLVTEMIELKHPYQKGNKARKGIEY